MSNFGKPLDEWHEEPVEIATVEPVIKNGRVLGLRQGKRTVMQKVRYSKLSEPSRLSCAENGHYWTIPDKHNHVAHCSNCPKRQFIRAVYEKVTEGQIVPRP